MKATTVVATVMLIAAGVSATGTAFTFYENKDADGDEVGPEDFEPDGQDKDVCASNDDGIRSVKFDASMETWEAAKSVATGDVEGAIDKLMEEGPQYCIWLYKEEDCDGCVRVAYDYDYSDTDDSHLNFEELGFDDDDDIKSAKVTVGKCPDDDDYDECGLF